MYSQNHAAHMPNSHAASNHTLHTLRRTEPTTAGSVNTLCGITARKVQTGRFILKDPMVCSILPPLRSVGKRAHTALETRQGPGEPRHTRTGFDSQSISNCIIRTSAREYSHREHRTATIWITLPLGLRSMVTLVACSNTANMPSV